MGSKYRQRHSRLFISLVESILRSVNHTLPSARPESLYTFTATDGAKFLRQYNTTYGHKPPTSDALHVIHRNNHVLKDLDVKTGMRRLRRTAQTRKHRSFEALMEHDVFKSLPVNEQHAVGLALEERMEEILVADCRARLGDGWEAEYQKLSVMQYAVPRRRRVLSWNDPIVLLGLEIGEEAGRLLERLKAGEGSSFGSWERLKEALEEFVAEKRDKVQSMATVETQSSEEVAEKG